MIKRKEKENGKDCGRGYPLLSVRERERVKEKGRERENGSERESEGERESVAVKKVAQNMNEKSLCGKK